MLNEHREVHRTKKPHRCEWCPEKIDTGQKATKRAYVYDGRFIASYLHPECWDALCKSAPQIDGFEQGSQMRGVAIDEYGDPLCTTPCK